MTDEQWQRIINEYGVEFAGSLVVALLEQHTETALIQQRDPEEKA